MGCFIEPGGYQSMFFVKINVTFFLELIEPAGEIPVNSDAHAVDKRRKYLFNKFY